MPLKKNSSSRYTDEARSDNAASKLAQTIDPALVWEWAMYVALLRTTARQELPKPSYIDPGAARFPFRTANSNALVDALRHLWRLMFFSSVE